MSNTHFTLVERCKLEIYLKEEKYFQYEIAGMLCKSASAISREIKRNSHPQFGYIGEFAQYYAEQRKKNSHRNSGRITTDTELQRLICETLRQK